MPVAIAAVGFVVAVFKLAYLVVSTHTMVAPTGGTCQTRQVRVAYRGSCPSLTGIFIFFHLILWLRQRGVQQPACRMQHSLRQPDTARDEGDGEARIEPESVNSLSEISTTAALAIQIQKQIPKYYKIMKIFTKEVTEVSRY